MPPSTPSSTRRAKRRSSSRAMPGAADAHVVLLGVFLQEANAPLEVGGPRAAAPVATHAPAARRRSAALRVCAPLRPSPRARRGRPSRPPRSRCCAGGSARRESAAAARAWRRRRPRRVPITGRPSGCGPKTASPSRSNTRSWGSSSYIAISSSTTSRSASSSPKRGRQSMSPITSNARSRCRSSTRVYSEVASLSVPALISAPIASKIWSISSEPKRSVPRNSMCSSRWEIPASSVVLGGRARADPEAERHRAHAGHALGDDSHAGVQRGYVDARRLTPGGAPRLSRGRGLARAAEPRPPSRRGPRSERSRPLRRRRRPRAGRRRRRRRRRCRRRRAPRRTCPRCRGPRLRRRPMRPRSRSTSTTRTLTSSPLLSTSSTVSTRWPGETLEMCSSPSVPFASSMKAPKVVVLTTLPRYSSPTSTSFIIMRMRSTSASPSSPLAE